MLALVCSLVITAGVFFTFSRMGLVLAMLLLALVPIARRKTLRMSAGTATTAVLLAVGIIATTSLLSFSILPGKYGAYVTHRVHETTRAVHRISEISPQQLANSHLSSLESRFLLGLLGFKVFLNHPWFGVGVFAVPEAIQKESGTNRPDLHNVAHNTVIQMFATGGLFGVFAVVAYLALLLRYLRYALRNPKDGLSISFIVVAAIFSIEALVLSLTFTAIYWLPLVLGTLCEMRKRKSLQVQAAAAGDLHGLHP